jgi:hypothetical protein
LTREQKAALSEVTVSESGNVRFKLGDKRAARMDIAKQTNSPRRLFSAE